MSTCKTKQKCSNDYFPVVGDLKTYVRPVSKIIPLFVDTTANSGHFTSSKGRKVHAMKCTKMKKARARATRAKLRTVSEYQICKFMLPSVCNSEKMSYHEILKQKNRGFPEPMAKPCYHRKLHQHIRGVYCSFILIWMISINIYKSGSRGQDINSNGLYKGRTLVTLRHILGSSALHLMKIVLFHDLSTLINARRIVQAGLWAGFETLPTILTVGEV